MRRIGAELWLVLVATLGFYGCGGGSLANPTQRLVVGVSASAAAIDRSQQLTLTAAVTNGGASDSTGVTWGNPTCSASSCGTLSSMSVTSATYQPPSSVASILTVTVTATSLKDPTQSGSATFIVAPDPAVSTSTAAVPAAIGSASYSLQLINGGTPPYNLQFATSGSIAAGSLERVSYPPANAASGAGCSALPSWLSFNANTGVLFAPKGVPTNATDFICALKVTDALGVTAASATVSILVPIVINTTTLPAAEQMQSAYSAMLSAEGGSGVFSWSVAGSLPAGLSLNSSTGIISGTLGPSATTQKFTIQVAGSANDAAVSQSFTIAVSSLLAIVPPSSADLTFSIGNNHSLTLQTSAGAGTAPFSWTALSALPQWLSLSPTTGLLSASLVPVTATNSQVTVQVTDALGLTATASFNITVPVIITTTSLPMAEPTEASYAGPLKAAGGSGTYSLWSLVGSSSFPVAGLMLNSSTGLISGTVGANASSQTFTIQVVDSNGAHGMQQFTLAVNPQLAIMAPLPANLAANIGMPYSFTLQNAAGTGVGPFTWSVASGSTAPPWLTLSSSGVLAASSVPATATIQAFTVEVKDAANVVATLPLTLTVPIIITPVVLPVAEKSQPYSATLQAEGGSGTYSSWSVVGSSSFPVAGLMLNSTSGLVSGTVGANASSQMFTIKVVDSNGASGTEAYTLSVTSGVVVTTTSLPNWTVNNSYSQNLSATGGSPPYSWSVASGSLPPGLSLDSSNGNISSIPGATGCPAGTTNFSVTVQDSLSIISPAQPLSITTTTAPVAITTTSIGVYSQGLAYSQQLQFSGGVCNPTVTWSKISGSLPTWATLSSSGLLSGTPGASDTGNFSFVVQVTDGATTATQSLTLAFSAIFTVSGQVSLANGAGPLENVTISLGSNQEATTDTNGNFSLQVPNGTYSVTPTFNAPTTVAPSSLFVPANSNITDTNGALAITVNGNNLMGVNLTALLGYTVSGKVSYAGKLNPAKLNRIFISLHPANCNNCSILGTSTPTPFGTPPSSSFSIHGVPPGTYTLQAWMDYSGYGIPNAYDPTGTAGPITLSVANGNVTNVVIAVNDPVTQPALDALPGPTLTASGIESGAIIQYQPIMQNGIEQASFYTLQWSATDANSCENSPDGSLVFNPIVGGNPIIAGSGRTVILDSGNNSNPNLIANSLPDKAAEIFCMQGINVNPMTGNIAPPGNWGVLNAPVVIGAPTGGAGTNTISGNVTIPEASGPLYAGCYDVNTGNIYSAVIESPVSEGQNPYSVSGVPTGAACFMFAMLDQDNDGFITPSNPTSFQSGFNDSELPDVYNTNAQNPTIVNIAGNTTQDVDLTPFANNSSSTLATQHVQATNLSGNTQESYNLNFVVTPLMGLPITVTLISGPNVVTPADFAICSTCGDESEFNIPLSSNGVRPQLGDTYVLQISYSDTSILPDVVTLTVTGVSDNFASSLSPTGSAPTDTPTFSWVDPSNPGSFMYQFLLSDSTGNTIWQVPGQGAFLNFFSSSITSVPWSSTADPTGAQNPPSIANLTSGATYTWSITVKDSNGNLTKTQVNITAP